MFIVVGLVLEKGIPNVTVSSYHIVKLKGTLGLQQSYDVLIEALAWTALESVRNRSQGKYLL